MVQTSARLLKLLSLLQSRRFWTGGELARELAITERSVRRDVDRLRSLGYPVHAATGIGGGYQLGAGRSCRRCRSRTTRPSPSRWGCARRRPGP